MDVVEKSLIQELEYKNEKIRYNRLPTSDLDRVTYCVDRLRKEYKYSEEQIEKQFPMVCLFIQYRGRMS